MSKASLIGAAQMLKDDLGSRCLVEVEVVLKRRVECGCCQGLPRCGTDALFPGGEVRNFEPVPPPTGKDGTLYVLNGVEPTKLTKVHLSHES